MGVTKEELIQAVKEIREDEMVVSYSAIARKLPKSTVTGKAYSREYIRQMLKTFEAGRRIYGDLMRKHLVKSKSHLPPLVLIEFEDWFPGQAGDRMRSIEATPQTVFGRIVYGMLPLELAALAQYCVGKEESGKICEYRVTKTNGFSSQDDL